MNIKRKIRKLFRSTFPILPYYIGYTPLFDKHRKKITFTNNTSDWGINMVITSKGGFPCIKSYRWLKFRKI